MLAPSRRLERSVGGSTISSRSDPVLSIPGPEMVSRHGLGLERAVGACEASQGPIGKNSIEHEAPAVGNAIHILDASRWLVSRGLRKVATNRVFSPMSLQPRNNVGLRGVAGALPPARLPLEQLSAQRRIVSSPADLASFGFRVAHIADAAHDAGWLVKEAARRALDDAGLGPDDVGLLIWTSALACSHLRPQVPGPETEDILSLFRYASGWLQDELALDGAEVMAVAQQGCASMFSALRLARASLLAEPELRHVLCVGVDVLPPEATREILYNVISDAACAVVVSHESPRDRWLGHRQISRGYYWDTPARQTEILAAYFPTARLCIAQLLERHGLKPDDIDWVVPSGVQRTSWDILLDLVGIPADRLYQAGESFGHTILADNFLLMNQLRRDGAVAAGAKLLLFTYGFGSSWCCVLLEH
jgi:3-oxoacyl-[acyl-carrier-protein] synthase-3